MLQTARSHFVYQASFFGEYGATRDFDSSQARRIALDGTSWIEHIPNWLGEPDALFAELMETAPWLQRDRWMYTRTVSEPRLTADYPDVAEVPLDALRLIAAALSDHYGVRYARYGSTSIAISTTPRHGTGTISDASRRRASCPS